MKITTTINQMLSGHNIFVPSNLPYSWETPNGSRSNYKRTHTDIFLQKLIDYITSFSKTPYYYGRFHFIQRFDKGYFIIDGQQKLTNIVILLSVLYTEISRLRYLTNEEILMYKRIIKLDWSYSLATVYYDNDLFIDYVINQIKKDKNNLETESAKRIVRAFDYFTMLLTGKDEQYLTKMLSTVSEATCTIKKYSICDFES